LRAAQKHSDLSLHFSVANYDVKLVGVPLLELNSRSRMGPLMYLAINGADDLRGALDLLALRVAHLAREVCELPVAADQLVVAFTPAVLGGTVTDAEMTVPLEHARSSRAAWVDAHWHLGMVSSHHKSIIVDGAVEGGERVVHGDVICLSPATFNLNSDFPTHPPQQWRRATKQPLTWRPSRLSQHQRAR
jgi:hypothetical protein